MESYAKHFVKYHFLKCEQNLKKFIVVQRPDFCTNDCNVFMYKVNLKQHLRIEKNIEKL